MKSPNLATPLDGAVFRKSLRLVASFCASAGPLSGILAAADGQRLLLAATDGTRVVQEVLPAGGEPVATAGVVIPGEQVKQLLLGTANEVGIVVGPGRFTLHEDGVPRSVDIADVIFPSYGHAIPQPVGHIDVETIGLLRALQQMHASTVLFSPHSHGVQLVSSESGQALVLSTERKGGAFHVRLGIPLLEGVLRSIGSENVRIFFGNPIEPVVIHAMDGRELFALAMPMQPTA